MASELTAEQTRAIASAISNMLRRVSDLRVQWRQARDAYFEPSSFRRDLQAAISTSRTVTFIVQSNKAVIPEFEGWYRQWTEKWADDPIMQWAKNARNKIEKQGDLETLSELRVELIGGYLGGPRTEWIPENILASVGDLRRTIPAKYMDDHMIENGSLLVERRWVDVELPDFEVLEALSRVYGQFVLMLIDLHHHLGAPIPGRKRKGGTHLLLDVGEDGRPDEMSLPATDHQITVSVKTGAVLLHRARTVPPPAPKDEKKIMRRIRDVKALAGLGDATTLSEVADIFFKTARETMLRDHYHIHLIVLMQGTKLLQLIRVQPADRQDKYLLMRNLAETVRELGADAVIYISETWLAKYEEIPTGKFAADAPARREGLCLSAANKAGEQFELRAEVERKKIKRHKVKRLAPTERLDGGVLMMFAQIYEVWGRLDMLKLDDESLSWPKEPE